MRKYLEQGLKEENRDCPFFRIHLPMANPEAQYAKTYLENQIQEMITQLEAFTGTAFSGDTFEESIRVYQEMRKAALSAEDAVALGKISFADYAQIAVNQNFLSPQEQTAAFQELISTASEADIAKKKKIILSGILPPSGEIIHIMEDAGLLVAGNDIAALYRAFHYTPRPVPDPGKYYTDLYKNHFPCPTLLYTADRRVDALLNMAEDAEAQALIFIGEKFCEYEYFEYPFLEKKLREKGIIPHLLEFSLDDRPSYGAYATRIQAFAESLNE